MSYLTELDVVNECLGTLGELPLNSLDDEHDLVRPARAALKRSLLREQAKVWWFNKEITTLTPDVTTGYITVPADTIRIDPTDETLNYVQRGTRLYQPYATAAVDKFKFTRPVQCWLIRELPYGDLPFMAQDVIALAAVLDFTKDYDADPMKVQQMKDDLREARIILNSEHIRNVNANRLRSGSVRRAMGRMAPTYYPYS